MAERLSNEELAQIKVRADRLIDRDEPSLTPSAVHSDIMRLIREVERQRTDVDAAERDQPQRWRCLAVGCNPTLDAHTAQEHKTETGHRVAKWPTRSAEGKRRARARNRGGYYDKYNTGHKSAAAYRDRAGRGRYDEADDWGSEEAVQG